jgi:hypothetical protein
MAGRGQMYYNNNYGKIRYANVENCLFAPSEDALKQILIGFGLLGTDGKMIRKAKRL